LPTAPHIPTPTFTRHDVIDASARDGGGQQGERVLVVIFLRGGADGLTLVPAIGDSGYYQARPSLAVTPADAIDLNGYFGLNRALQPLEKFYKSGELAIVHGAGSEDHSRSHFEAQDCMEHGGHDAIAAGSGWLGRYMRARGEAGAAALSAVAIGTTRPESLRGAPSGAVMQSIRDFSFGEEDPAIIDQLAKLYAAETGALGAAGRETIDAVKRLRAVRSQNSPPANGAVYPDTQFGRGLREIARLIRADVGLLTTTIDLGGWDTHFVQQQLIGGLMAELAAGIEAFTIDLGVSLGQRVTIVTMTEFGRRLRENTSFGTDHGAGGVMLTLTPGGPEGAFGGGTIRSGWRDLSPSNLDEVGDVPATINYRDVLAPVLRAHAPGIDLSRVFPGHAFDRA
jgi:uncharacterized protein (DUF1501 family)